MHEVLQTEALKSLLLKKDHCTCIYMYMQVCLLHRGALHEKLGIDCMMANFGKLFAFETSRAMAWKVYGKSPFCSYVHVQCTCNYIY